MLAEENNFGRHGRMKFYFEGKTSMDIYGQTWICICNIIKSLLVCSITLIINQIKPTCLLTFKVFVPPTQLFGLRGNSTP